MNSLGKKWWINAKQGSNMIINGHVDRISFADGCEGKERIEEISQQFAGSFSQSNLWFCRMSPIHPMLAKFENGFFTLKTHQMFSIHTTPGKFENATITGHFGFAFEETRGGT